MRWAGNHEMAAGRIQTWAPVGTLTNTILVRCATPPPSCRILAYKTCSGRLIFESVKTQKEKARFAFERFVMGTLSTCNVSRCSC